MGTWHSSFRRYFVHLDGTTITMTTPTRKDCVSSNLLALEMLWATKAFKLSIYHDGNTATQGFAFFHAETKLR